ncbi:MAG TPA: DUF3761 domain-containing protein [Gemmatimonadaceae bacterium]|nr:DUF3761 domain-containing protein [Gemmatimonadaceae bacterium]
MLHARTLVSLSGALFALTMFTATAHAQDSTAKPICKDGTTSTTTGRGACSHHGGVDKTKTTSTGAVAPAPATSPAPAAQPAATTPTTKMSSSAGKTSKSENNDPTGAIAKCKDGLYSHSAHHTGACSRHGGVAQWLDSTGTKK